MKELNYSLASGLVGLLGLALFGAACTGGDSTTDGSSSSTTSSGASTGGAGGSGGSSTGGLGGAGGASTGGAGGSGGSSTGGLGGAGGAATTSTSGTEVSCDELRAQVTAALKKAQACLLTSTKPIAECTTVVEGLCCPTVVAREGSDEANAYLELLTAFQDRADCASNCPDLLCNEIVSGTCEKDSGSSSSTTGVCVGSNTIDL